MRDAKATGVKELLRIIESEKKSIKKMMRGHADTVGSKDYWIGRLTEVNLIYNILKDNNGSIQTKRPH